MKFILSIIFILFIAGCSNDNVKPTINTSLKSSELPSQESWNSTIVFSDSGKTKAILTTGHLRAFDQLQETLFDDGLKVDFYDTNMVKTSTITSQRGKVNDATKDLYAIDSVVAVNDSGTVLKTQELEFRNNDQKIVSDKFVTIISPKETIQGYGFESDRSLRNYVIYNITYVTRTDTTKK
jgi:LPS export ABC transporter protein LptC